MWVRSAFPRSALAFLSGALVVSVCAAPAAAQSAPAGVRGELIGDITQLEAKYVGLAGAMGEHLGWRPGDGVRSASEAMMHVAAANYMIASIAGVPMPAGLPGGGDMRAMGSAMEAITDAGEVAAALQRSFEHARSAIAGTSDADLEGVVTLFGRETTRRATLTLMVSHMHEHLGQLIAYARTNGITPPWSGE
ncbi:MAG TPA: DinB family protein [Longimicrobiales bacterium]|nr:DinB family protein [Longimicrobiales bacterium]